MNKKEQFIQAVQQNEGLIYKVAAFYTDNREDRDDLVQEIIYNLWKSFETFSGQSALSTWMYRVAMNVAIFHLKKNSKRPVSVAIGEQALNMQDTTNNDMEEKLQQLQQHVKTLNLLDRGIVMLYLEDKTHEEIAQVTGLSKTNVGTRLMRIKEKLAKQIIK